VKEGPTPQELAVLSALIQCHGDPISIESLAARAATDVASVRHSLHHWESLGCRLEPCGVDAIRLLHSGWRTWACCLQQRRESKAPIEVHGSLDSTQDRARTLVETHGANADGALVLANVQTHGRGRMGRRWSAPADTSVLLSRASVDTESTCESRSNRWIAASVIAVATGIEAAAGGRLPPLQIRWPNDLVVDDRKLAGILVESFPLPLHDRVATVVGVGINVSLDPEGPAMPPQDQGTAVTTLRRLGITADRLAVAANVMEALDRTDIGDDAVFDQWRHRCVLPSEPVRVRHDGRWYEGTIVSADPAAGLILRHHDGATSHLPAASASIERPIP